MNAPHMPPAINDHLCVTPAAQRTTGIVSAHNAG